MSEVGTLNELGVGVGDRVSDSRGKPYTIYEITSGMTHPRARFCDHGTLAALSDDGLDTHRITFNLIDGKPDCASVKMEEL